MATDMRAFPRIEGGEFEILNSGWRMAAGHYTTPFDLENADWLSAIVPGTVAGALANGGKFDPQNPHPLQNQDFWYQRIISGAGNYDLRFDGLATLADVYLDETLVLSSSNMFHKNVVNVTLQGDHRLSIHFRALTSALAASKPRARWRTQMIPDQGLRHVRTTLLGHMPGWCPNIEAVGPWRPISLVKTHALKLRNLLIQAELHGDNGKLYVDLDLESGKWVELQCGEHSTPMHDKGDTYRGILNIENVRKWWPHTHGEPALYPLSLTIDGQKIDLGNTGFRQIVVDRGADGKDFALFCNGQPIFCRGAVWTNADLLTLSGTRETYAVFLQLARDANFNMLRMSGTGAYETRAFYDLCAELGILVWQDFMFANFDYPTSNEDFSASCSKEAADFLETTQGNPALAVLCGGSEMYQQAAMMGLPAASWPQDLSETILEGAGLARRPDLAHVVNSPSGGPLPFAANEGVTHYYGVGAYKRPLDDARRANLRFATECLASSQIPDCNLDPADAHWKHTVPKDRGASWDFEDTREFYLETLFKTDAAQLRKAHPQLWLEASRAVTGHVTETTFAEWRRVGSSCNGALVWTFQDMQAGLGWGIVTAKSQPKPVWFALKRACNPQQVLLTDEGCNGLSIHLINERAAPLAARLEFSCLQHNGLAIIHEEKYITLPPRSAQEISAASMIGAFFDTTYAYRFGPQAHYGSVAKLYDRAAGTLIAEAFHFPEMRALDLNEIAFAARLEVSPAGTDLILETPEFLHFVHIHDVGLHPSDNWFHLEPGRAKRVKLAGFKPESKIEVSALNATNRVTIIQ